jgi:hypothetical protein
LREHHLVLTHPGSPHLQRPFAFFPREAAPNRLAVDGDQLAIVTRPRKDRGQDAS